MVSSLDIDLITIFYDLFRKEYEREIDMLAKLKLCLVEYERQWMGSNLEMDISNDPLSKIVNKGHQEIRTECVLYFGAELVQDFIARVYEEDIHPLIFSTFNQRVTEQEKVLLAKQEAERLMAEEMSAYYDKLREQARLRIGREERSKEARKNRGKEKAHTPFRLHFTQKNGRRSFA